ncbi:MAG: hypothetical protein IPF69_00285 [Chitinophagaceae bacterium]|nr:hypothetical protein [Chitinophagaceae bacterium]
MAVWLTPFIDDKIDKYFAQLVVPHPDSVIKEMDRMLGPAASMKKCKDTCW